VIGLACRISACAIVVEVGADAAVFKFLFVGVDVCHALSGVDGGSGTRGGAG
jgi:hypothetical protein